MNTTSFNTASTSVKSINKSNLMKTAWAAFRKNGNITFAEALKQAWKALKLKAQMALGVVKFTFRKANGELREALGTLLSDLVNYEYKGSGNAKCGYNVAFFDVEKHAFRSFNVWTLI